MKAIEAQIANVADAIATKGLAGSTTLVDKLQSLSYPASASASNLRDLQRALRHNPDQARTYLRRLLAGPVFLEPEGDLLYANFAMDGTRVALIAGATPGARDLDGSGGALRLRPHPSPGAVSQAAASGVTASWR